MDPPAGTYEQFKKRSLNNYNNRTLHQHVFDLELLAEIGEFIDMKVIFKYINGTDQYIAYEKN